MEVSSTKNWIRGVTGSLRLIVVRQPSPSSLGLNEKTTVYDTYMRTCNGRARLFARNDFDELSVHSSEKSKLLSMENEKDSWRSVRVCENHRWYTIGIFRRGYFSNNFRFLWIRSKKRNVRRNCFFFFRYFIYFRILGVFSTFCVFKLLINKFVIL